MTKPIIPKRRIITEKNNLIEIVAWQVPKSKFYPKGIKYSFTFVKNQRFLTCSEIYDFGHIHKNKRTIAFDNFNNEGHHKHYLNKKEYYKFKSLEETLNQFFMLIKEFEKTQGDEND